MVCTSSEHHPPGLSHGWLLRLITSGGEDITLPVIMSCTLPNGTDVRPLTGVARCLAGSLARSLSDHQHRHLLMNLSISLINLVYNNTIMVLIPSVRPLINLFYCGMNVDSSSPSWSSFPSAYIPVCCHRHMRARPPTVRTLRPNHGSWRVPEHTLSTMHL